MLLYRNFTCALFGIIFDGNLLVLSKSVNQDLMNISKYLV